MTMLPDDPFHVGKAEDLQQDATAIATEKAQKKVDEAHDAQAALLQKTMDKGSQSDGDVTGADETFISEKDLGFLNGK